MAIYLAKVDGDEIGKPPRLPAAEYRVEKMRFGKSGIRIHVPQAVIAALLGTSLRT